MWRQVQVRCSVVSARYMSTGAPVPATSGIAKDNAIHTKEAYIKHMAAVQSETAERPAEWNSAKLYTDMPGWLVFLLNATYNLNTTLAINFLIQIQYRCFTIANYLNV